MNAQYQRNPSGEQDVFGSPGCFIKGWEIWNGTAAVVFVQVFNAAKAEVIPGTTVPKFVIAVKATDKSSVIFPDEGIEMNAFSYIVTTQDGNSTEPSPSDGTDTIDITFFTK